METEFLYHPHNYNRTDRAPAVMALGYFDGVHIGHQTVIRRAVEKAEAQGVEAVVMTFHPHPKAVLSPDVSEEDMRYITPLAHKEALIHALGVDRLIVISFDRTLASLTPQAFVDHYLLDLHAVEVVAGFDFSYGHKGRGTMETLPFHARGMLFQETIDQFSYDGEKVSSTRIRELIRDGAVGELPPLLNRDFSLYGEVASGEQRGRTIGFPTANIYCSQPYLLPAIGVYAVTLETDEARYQGVANVGYKPTFHSIQEGDPTVEVHLFDFSGDLYGCAVKVTWHDRIRGEIAFSGVEELKMQIDEDCRTAKAYFNEKG
ncbi:FMN adenylyltransferase /riboflavin kinase [Salsuginibacillus halophilus]|uniref:Riboflavin biosynthesis protein n=1 Tax=Salsuginibacillus halophilus TaxID=517424 RepID=A0A2P8HYH8_9BACI|nr:FMN adenylyltransferase /riboflavin kinase [Salsuginibacillus halophilus]